MSARVEGLPSDHDALVEKLGKIAWYLEHARRGEFAGGVRLTGLNLKVPAGLAGESLCVIKGVTEEDVPVVAFQSGDSVIQAMLKSLSKWWDGELRYKADEWRSR